MLSKISNLVVLLGLVCSVQAEVFLEQGFNENADHVTFEANGGTADRSGTESEFTAANPGASIRLVDTSSDGNPEAALEFPMNDLDQPLKILFDCRLERLNGENVAFDLRGFNEQGILLTLWSWNGAGISYHDGHRHQVLRKAPLEKHVWYRFEITVPAAGALEKCFGLKVVDSDNVEILSCSDLVFRENIFSYELIRWFFNNQPSARGSEVCIDNVLIETVLEPLG